MCDGFLSLTKRLSDFPYCHYRISLRRKYCCEKNPLYTAVNDLHQDVKIKSALMQAGIPQKENFPGDRCTLLIR